jgi:hypothetical protein
MNYQGRARNGRERWTKVRQKPPEDDNELIERWLEDTIDPENEGDRNFLAALVRALSRKGTK